MYSGHGVTSDFKVWARGHSRISVDTNCVPGLSRKYSTYGGDHLLTLKPLFIVEVFMIKGHMGTFKGYITLLTLAFGRSLVVKE